MTWLLIGLLVLAAIGPIFWVLPSPGERRQMRLRNRAMAAGVQVRLRTYPDPGAPATERVTAGGRVRKPRRQVMTYRMPVILPPRARRMAPVWCWLRHRDAEAAGEVPAGWTADPPSAQGDATYWQQVRELVASLPATVVAVEAGPEDVALAWLEHGEEDAADAIVATLEQLRRIHQGWTSSQLQRDDGQDD